jgi:co-chaperonin GroES (HSP10)
MTIFARSTNTQVNSSFRPIGQRICVKKLLKEEKMRGGILIPDNAMSGDAIECLVVSVGAKVEGIAPGDHIWTHRQLSFNRFEKDAELHFIVPMEHALARNT